MAQRALPGERRRVRPIEEARYGETVEAAHLDQLRHRRDTLPERADLEGQSDELARLDAGLADAEPPGQRHHVERPAEEPALLRTKDSALGTADSSATPDNPGTDIEGSDSSRRPSVSAQAACLVAQ